MMTLQHTLRRASFHLTPRTRELRGRYKTRVASFKFQTLVVTTYGEIPHWYCHLGSSVCAEVLLKFVLS
jgi:hypothetical protein